MSPLLAKVEEEFAKLLPPTIFFFGALHMIALVRSLMLKGTGIALASSLMVTIAALTLGKAVLLADALPFVNRFSNKPLAWIVAWKSVLYFIVATFIHYLENLYDFWKEAGGLISANEKLLAEMVWAHFFATEILVASILLTYCTAGESIRAIGGAEARAMFFGPIPKQHAKARCPPT